MEENIYKKGDWIVHSTYGVGQIQRIETKTIHGEQADVFRVKTRDSIYWLPVANADNSRIRPIADKDMLEKALELLTSKPAEMGSDYRVRNTRIKEIFSNGSLLEKVELLRDLLGIRSEKFWSNTENDAVHTIFEQLVNEYMIGFDIPVEVAREKINAVILSQFEDYSLV